MGMKEIQEAQREFYLNLQKAMQVAPATFNARVAESLITENSYYEDLTDSMKVKLITLCQSKTNWGKNLFKADVQVCMLECLLGI